MSAAESHDDTMILCAWSVVLNVLARKVDCMTPSMQQSLEAAAALLGKYLMEATPKEFAQFVKDRSSGDPAAVIQS